MEIFVLKPFVVGKLGLFSVMQNDALMHREGLKGVISLSNMSFQVVSIFHKLNYLRLKFALEIA